MQLVSPPPPPHSQYKYDIGNFSKVNVLYHARGALGASGQVDTRRSATVYAEGDGTGIMTLGSRDKPSGQCIVYFKGFSSDTGQPWLKIEQHADGSQGFDCTLNSDDSAVELHNPVAPPLK